KPYRGQGYAHELMLHVLDFLQSQHFKLVELHAQLQAIPFYEKLGFESFGDIFLDAGIQHVAMKKIV
ncbi:MAG: GNAT family N-acetyltransferase, partial [Lactococcus raffinolactis]